MMWLVGTQQSLLIERNDCCKQANNKKGFIGKARAFASIPINHVISRELG